MRDEVINVLQQLAAEKNCRFLFAAESGSRAWGFASPDSDYDIRAIYVKPESWYWDISDKKRDTIEAQLPGDLDISAWELRKALQLFSKCNPSLNEWLGSPIIYYAEAGFLATMRELLPKFFNPTRAGFHYLTLAQNAWESVDIDRQITLKKLFYAQRGLFCSMWSALFKTMPPTEFEKLLIPELLPEKILKLVRELIGQKIQAGEKATIPVPDLLFDFYTEQREKLVLELPLLKCRTADHAILGEILQNYVQADL